MKPVLYTILLSAALLTKAMAQDSSAFPKGEIGKNTDNYTGTIWLNELNKPDSNFNFSIAIATYAPGSKLDWHIHPGGQILLITEGTGYYQEKGKPVQIIHKGDVINAFRGWNIGTQQRQIVASLILQFHLRKKEKQYG